MTLKWHYKPYKIANLPALLIQRYVKSMRCHITACIAQNGRHMWYWHILLTLKSLFSSPEHNVLRMSYCDQSSSGVRPSVREQLLKKSSPLKRANRFQWNFTEMILGWCTVRMLQRYEFHEELWLLWQPKEKTLKIFLSQTVRARAFIFGM